MNIIVDGPVRSVVEEHAKNMIKFHQQRAFKSHEPQPLGIPVHTALHPIICDDCGDTYWANDPYASHRKCSRNGKLGF